MCRSLKLSCAVAAALSLSTPVLAADPQPLEVGKFNLTPLLGVEYTHTDNVYLNPGVQQSSNILEINPSIQAYTANSGGSDLVINAEIADGNYSISSADDYTDWRVSAAGNLVLDTRNLLTLQAYAYDGHERRGTGYSQGGLLLAEPDTYSDTFLGGNYQFGMDDSPNIVLSVSKLRHRYDPNTILSRARDLDTSTWAATFTYPVSPRTGLLLEYVNRDLNYLTEPAPVVGGVDTPDSTESIWYVGATWEATALTTGTIKLGSGDKDFDDPDRPDTDSFNFDINIVWTPLTYSTVTFLANKAYGENYNFGNSLDSTQYGVNWSHEWSDSISSLAFYTAQDNTYDGSTRQDDITNFGIGVNYALQRWMDVNLSVSNNERDSTFSPFSYDETSVILGLVMSL